LGTAYFEIAVFDERAQFAIEQVGDRDRDQREWLGV
jgi:hypothetical protein